MTRVKVPALHSGTESKHFRAIWRQLDESGVDPQTKISQISDLCRIETRIAALTQKETDGGDIAVSRAVTTLSTERRRLLQLVFEKPQGSEPEGDPEPSEEDWRAIEKLKPAHDAWVNFKPRHPMVSFAAPYSETEEEKRLRQAAIAEHREFEARWGERPWSAIMHADFADAVANFWVEGWRIPPCCACTDYQFQGYEHQRQHQAKIAALAAERFNKGSNKNVR